MIFPYFWMVVTSLKGEANIFSFPPSFIPNPLHLENYLTAFATVPLATYFLNSAFISVVITAASIMVTAMAGYALARWKFPGSNLIFYTAMAILIVPSIVTIIPNFILITRIGLYNSYPGMLLPYITWNLPIATFIFKNYFSYVPQSLYDAARIDGSSEFKIFWRVMLPLAKPAAIAVGVFTYLFGWDEFVWALTVTNNDAMRTMPVGLALFLGRYTTSWNLLTAASVVGTLPGIIFFLLFQKQVISALAAWQR
jgi:multiple sugar transport system permease protein